MALAEANATTEQVMAMVGEDIVNQLSIPTRASTASFDTGEVAGIIATALPASHQSIHGPIAGKDVGRRPQCAGQSLRAIFRMTRTHPLVAIEVAPAMISPG